MLLLEAVPVGEIRQRRVVRKARAVARRGDSAVGEFEAEEFESQIADHRCDLGKREAQLLHVEQEVAATTQAVEVLATRDSDEKRIAFRGQDGGSRSADSVGRGFEAVFSNELARVGDTLYLGKSLP